MARLFGTDGVRGVANTELTGELAFRLGRAGAYVLTKETKHAPRILVAMDTRISGDMLESALVSGICSVGAHAVVAGVIPTPAVAYLVRKYRLDAGVMISASHNPVEYNGIKFFNNQGYKLSDALEDEIENIIMSHPEILPSPTGIGLGTKEYAEDALDDYIAFLTRTTTEKFDGIKVALDCANGAAIKRLPLPCLIWAQACASSIMSLTGTNINDKCGSTHMDDLKEMVVKNGADIGFAFDGDADRCLAVDEKGNLIDGDKDSCHLRSGYEGKRRIGEGYDCRNGDVQPWADDDGQGKGYPYFADLCRGQIRFGTDACGWLQHRRRAERSCYLP